MFLLIKRVMRFGKRTVTIYIGPEEEKPVKPRNIGLKLLSLVVAIMLVAWVRWWKGG